MMISTWNVYFIGGKTMKTISVYDIEAEAIEKISEDNDIPECEIIEMLMEYAEQMKQDNGLK